MTDAELTAYEVALQLRGYEVRYTRGTLHCAELYLGGEWCGHWANADTHARARRLLLERLVSLDF